jgi:hypothetical protein
MAEITRREIVLPTIPEGIDPRLDEYLRQVNEIIQDLSMSSASWDGYEQLGFVDRGDPSDYDWTESSFTFDSTWRDLDCSSIVPINTAAIAFRASITDDSTASYFALRKNGSANDRNEDIIFTRIADIRYDSLMIVACDVDRVVEYRGTSGIDNFDLVVRGWWLNEQR